MRRIIQRIVLIVGLLALCVWAIYPPEQKIRLGKDLRGGVSLVYHVRLDPSDNDPQATIGQMISVLKERVNPQGTLDISIQAMGADRIEIVMPLPNKEVRELRAFYEKALNDLLREGHISPTGLQRALAAHTAVERFGGAGGSRREQIEGLQTAYDDLQAAWDTLEAAQEAGSKTLGPLEDAVAVAEIDFDNRRARVLGMSLDRARVDRALRLSTARKPEIDRTTGEPVLDPQTGEPRLQPSPRQIEVDSVADDFPHLAAALVAVVADYDAYADQRKGFDDPEDLMRLLRGAGVLEYRIAVRNSDPQAVTPSQMREQLADRGPRETDSPVAAWFPINDLKQWYKEPEQLAALQKNPVAYFASPTTDLVAAERDGQHYLLLYTTESKSITHEGSVKWSMVRTFSTVDNLGRPAVGFTLDAPGGRLMNALTGAHVGEPMGILLDGQIYSAPNINQPIAANGIIQGNFSKSELNYLTRVLAAGSLEAKLSQEPIAMNTLGPSIGADNLRRGMGAFKVAIIAVAAFMMLYYFFAGFVADLALLANGLIIFGMMSLIDGTFTLPGLAGLVLTIGMAVDANVLIYERIREELASGEDLRASIRVGYRKALSTILDANVTNLIVCFVLFQTATTEVKGFALTLSIGICGTLFTALFVTRVIFALYTDVAHFRRLPMLPTVVPLVSRLLSPRINWMGLRAVFWTVSIVAVTVSLGLVYARGADLLDTEFRGGVSITMRTAAIDLDYDGTPDDLDDRGEPVRLLLPETGPQGVERRVHALAGILDPDPADERQVQTKQRMLAALRASGVMKRTDDPQQLMAIRAILAELANASVLTVGETEIRDGDLHATSFQVKVASPKGLGSEKTTTGAVVAAIVAEFGDQLDVTQPLSFRGAGTDRHAPHTYAITRESLGVNIDRPRFVDQVTEFLGGVAVVVEDLDPPVHVDDVNKRVSRMRAQPDFKDYVGRDVDVIGLQLADPADPGEGYRSVAVLVYDAELSYFDVEFDLWDGQLARAEWLLVSEALQRQTSLEQVSSYSPAMAETLSAKATVSVVLCLLGILVYIWVRFGSLRYSAAAIIALMHDVALALGVLAATAWIARTALGSALLIEDFRIDLGVVAGLLTIIGYSLNDTIVILDRIRENRGKLPIPTADIVNRSINQTISRTVLTSVTTLLAVGIMYAFGGSGIRSFSFTLLVGLVVGTYSSVAIAAPLVVRSGSAGIKGAIAGSSASATTGPDDAVFKEKAAAST